MISNSIHSNDPILKKAKEEQAYLLELYSFVPYYCNHYNPSKEIQLFLLEHLKEQAQKVKLLGERAKLLSASHGLVVSMN